MHGAHANGQVAADAECRPAILYDSPAGIFRIEPPRPAPIAAGFAVSGISKPHLSPDGGSLVWVQDPGSDGLAPELWLGDAAATGARPLTPGLPGDQPAWSPDGTRIAFTADLDGNAEIYVIAVDGGNLQRVTWHAARDEYPAWSPDGEQIAFGSQRSGNYDIFVAPSDGDGAAQQLTFSPAVDFRPSWSPDGHWIAFSSTRADSLAVRTYNYDIYLMRRDGSDIHRLTFHSLLALRPSWSPRGDAVAYQVGGGTDDNTDWGIYTVSVEGGPPRRWTHNNIADAHPDWNTFQVACRPE